jgi:hypothetical protein
MNSLTVHRDLIAVRINRGRRLTDNLAVDAHPSVGNHLHSIAPGTNTVMGKKNL